MPDYTVSFTGPNGWLYHDRGFTQPFTQQEMEQVWRQRSTYPGAQPGGSPIPFQPPSQQNFPRSNMPTYDLNYQPGMPGQQQYGSNQQGGGFPWAPVIQGASQLYSSYLNKRATDKTRAQQQQNLQGALAQLTPEAIRALMQQFYTQNYAMLNPAMQSAQQGVKAGAGRTGLTGAGVVKQLQAGIPGQFANMAFGQASNQALGVAGQRASTLSGAPVTAPYSFGNDLQGIMQMMGRYGLLKNPSEKKTEQPANQWWIEGPGHSNVWT